jgi:hypothetical protein
MSSLIELKTLLNGALFVIIMKGFSLLIYELKSIKNVMEINNLHKKIVNCNHKPTYKKQAL